MPMLKLTLPPDQSAYSVTDGSEVVSSKLDGGASRYRRDVLNSTSTVSAQWTVGPEAYKYLRAFFKSVTTNGALPFLIDLLLDEPILTEHKAYFVPGSMSLGQQQGMTYFVRASLEVYPIVQNDAANVSYVEMFNALGYTGPAVLNRLAILVNIDMPGSLQ